jgi:[ribosomal protein S5]-alanine N-acetyltransferase
MEIEFTLRPLKINDIDEEYCNWYENDDGHLNYFSGSGRVFNPDILLRDFESSIINNDTFYYLISAKSGARIGTIKIGPVDSNNKTSDLVCLIGNRSFIGKGIGSRAIAIASELAFKKHDIRRLHSGMHANNLSSIKAYTKAGWFIEGIFKGYYLLNGVAADRVCVACLNPSYFSIKTDVGN